MRTTGSISSLIVFGSWINWKGSKAAEIALLENRSRLEAGALERSDGLGEGQIHLTIMPCSVHMCFALWLAKGRVPRGILLAFLEFLGTVD